jgi:2-oxoisovalerate dehydrogenase E1 component
MSLDRTGILDRRFGEAVRVARPKPSTVLLGGGGAPRMPADRLLEVFDSQCLTRHLDLIARVLRAEGTGYYTIASAGHEGNAVLGALTRATDPAFLHYRSGAFMLERARQRPGVDPVEATLWSLMAAADDPIAQGRHKVWGSRELWVPPQTSTIASHLPKAVGAAVAIERRVKLELGLEIPADSLVVCSFGDASINHSTAQGAFNAASWMACQRLPVPILWVCEDNGLGISVATPPGWIEAAMSSRPGIAFVKADGLDVEAAWAACSEAVSRCRRHRQPVFLQLRTVRLLGHAGTDVEQGYRTLEQIEATEAKDPLVATALALRARGLLTAEEALGRYEAARARVQATAERLKGSRRLESLPEVTRTLAPRQPKAEAQALAELGEKGTGTGPAAGRPPHLAEHVNRALHEALATWREVLVFGEDVAKKGGVYGVTAGLWKAFGSLRVFNTLLDEQAILGLASGLGHLGFLPIPEIQYLAYFHNACDQLRGEACSLQYFSSGQFQNPMLVRIASFAYQKGFGGHFHNEHSVAALRDIPGLVIAAPARGEDAVGMFRTCLALARGAGRVSAFLEPIALYHTRDLHEPGDSGWLDPYPAPGVGVPLGEGRVYHPEARDLTLVSYANGLYRSLRVARRLQREHGIGARVVDLRWIAPLDLGLVAREARATGRLLVVDECRRQGGLGTAIVAETLCREPGIRAALLAAEDTYLPLGPAMELCLPTEDQIAGEALRLTRTSA